MDFEIGWARDDEAGRLRALLMDDGLILEGGEWVGLGSTWLVAREGGVVRACMAVHHGRPIARLDFLSIDRDITGLSRVRVYKAIVEAAIAIVAQRGASFVAGVVAYTDADHGDRLVGYGGKVLNEGWLYIAPVGEVLRKITNGRR